MILTSPKSRRKPRKKRSLNKKGSKLRNIIRKGKLRRRIEKNMSAWHIRLHSKRKNKKNPKSWLRKKNPRG
jgi:hypothetical protein